VAVLGYFLLLAYLSNVFLVRHKAILLLICTLFAVFSHAQYERLRNYTVKDGLPGSETYGVTQDSEGYMWVIGDMGVSKFNGYGFKNFSTADGLPDNTFFGIWEDTKNRLWLRSFSGKLSYIRNDSVFTLPCNDTLEKLFKFALNTSIYVDTGDTIWLGANFPFLLKISPHWKKTDLQKTDMEPGKYIYEVDKTGFVYGGSSPEKPVVNCFSKQFIKLFSIDPGITNPIKQDPRFFLCRSSNGTYIASLASHLLNFNTKGIIRKTESDQIIIHLLEDSDGSIAVSTYNGMRLLDKNDWNKKRDLIQLKNKVITGAVADKEKELWISTEGNGLFCLEHRNFKYYSPENGLSESKISCMGMNKEHVITGHLDGSIGLLRKDSIIRLLANDPEKSSVLQTRVNSIFSSKEKTIVNTVQGSYFLRGNKLSEIAITKNKGIKKILEMEDGTFWMLRYSRLTKYTSEFSEIKDIPLNLKIDNIDKDKKGGLWLFSRNTIYKLKNDKPVKDTSLNFGEHRPVAITEDHKGNIWLITRGGGVFVRMAGKTLRITEKSGLASDICKAILADSTVVWIGTNKGLSKIELQSDGNYTIKNMYDHNGLLTNEINSILKRGNEIWLAHSTGITIFDAKHYRTNTYSMPVYITSVLVNDSIKNKTRLSYNENYITLNYLGLSFRNAGHIEYRYKMVGIDSNWTYSNYTSVKYQAMPPGTYTFYVFAKNSDGHWSKNAGTISFIIEPALWQTFRFKLMVILLIAILILLVFKWRLRILARREHEKALLQNRIAQTELKALRAQMNPHFIYNAINSVQYFITNNDPESSQKYLAKFARLIRYVVDNSKPASIPLQTEINALLLYLDLEALRFERRFEYKVEIGEGIDANFIQIPSMLVQPYVENAIWHGLMHKDGAGKIDISFTMEPDILKCVIKDDGIGRKRSKEIKQKDSVPRRSLGMAITQERLEIINQMNNTELNVVITDLFNEKNEGIGTKVELFIPFN
jgi:ligand-binding sensor domain-containing protein